MEKMTTEEKEAAFKEYLQKPPYPVDALAELIAKAPEGKAGEWTQAVFAAFAESQDFAAAIKMVRALSDVKGQPKLQGTAVRDMLRRTTKDRLQQAFIDSVGFDVRTLKESLGRLERLLSFHEGSLVLSAAWGLGDVKRLDYFYRRITVDFPQRKGHQFTFDAACETLVPAPENHILVIAHIDKPRVEMMLKDKPGDFVKEMLTSFGDMPITRLETLCAQHGFVKAANWKEFWNRARAALRAEKVVEIPTRRTEPLHLKVSAETYGEGWFTAFSQMTDPKSILSAVRELQGRDMLQRLDADSRAKLANRLAFALKGARNVDDALYVRLAFCLYELKLDATDKDGKPLNLVAKARAYLWENNRYLAAAQNLPARDTENFVEFLTAADRESTKKALFAALPEMSFSLLTATLTLFSDDADCEDACAALLRDPAAPATLVAYVLGRYDKFTHWKRLPALIVILTHAIALGEGRQSGETLRMQNTVRRLFADQKWLEGIFKKLPPADQALFFERFQASIAWDPSTHHMIVVRMMRIVPALAAHQVKRAAPQQIARITSLRSYAERKAAYQKLVNVDIPKNAHDIDVARSYGDLRENFEYQSAKDEQRALLQKQSLMQEELNAVKAVDFADVATDAVGPGTTVAIRTAAGEERAYTVLGEWDNDLAHGIISNKTRLAQNMMGKHAGDSFELPDAEGNLSAATIVSISALSDELRGWVQVPAGLSI